MSTTKEQFLVVLVVAAFAFGVRQGATQCASGPVALNVNESSPAGTVLQVLDSSYDQTSPPGAAAAYACYFEIASSALRLRRQFDLENFTSCVDGSVIPIASIVGVQTVTVACSSGGGTATFLVPLVDVNEFPPVFSPDLFRVNVSEAAAVGTEVIQLSGYASDRDFSNKRTFNLFIVSGSQGDFAMNSGITSGKVTIIRALDYDAGTRQYIMNVSAVDLPSETSSLPVPLTGYATLIVDVTDADDKSPEFTSTSSYTLRFMENDTSVIGVPLETSPPLLARDGDTGINQTINYAIASASWSGIAGTLPANETFLTINQTTGRLTVSRLIGIRTRATTPAHKAAVLRPSRPPHPA